MLLSNGRKNHSAVPILYFFYIYTYYFEQCRCMSLFRKVILISAVAARRVQNWGRGAHVNVARKEF